MAKEDLDNILPDDESEILESPESSAEESEIVHYRFRVSKNLTRRVDQYLTDRVSYLSRAGVQRLIDDDLVKVNGKPTKASYHPRTNDIVEMVAPPKPISELIPEPIPLEVVYEDEHFMAINKQAGIMVHPARGKWTGTLVNGLVYYGQKWSSVNGNWRPGILHRLDRNTTGIMLIAKSDEAHWRLARQFENRTIQKTYVAVTHGVPPLHSDIIDLPIGKDRYVREKQAIRRIENGGRPAVTIYEVLQTFEQHEEATLSPGDHPKDQKNPHPPQKYAFLKLTPKTGRTHQLRVHMTALGFPMVGDTMYNGHIFTLGDFKFERQALHAAEITFTHPATLEKMTLKAPLPPDITTLLHHLGATTINY